MDQSQLLKNAISETRQLKEEVEELEGKLESQNKVVGVFKNLDEDSLTRLKEGIRKSGGAVELCEQVESLAVLTKVAREPDVDKLVDQLEEYKKFEENLGTYKEVSETMASSLDLIESQKELLAKHKQETEFTEALSGYGDAEAIAKALDLNLEMSNDLTENLKERELNSVLELFEEFDARGDLLDAHTAIEEKYGKIAEMAKSMDASTAFINQVNLDKELNTKKSLIEEFNLSLSSVERLEQFAEEKGIHFTDLEPFLNEMKEEANRKRGVTGLDLMMNRTTAKMPTAINESRSKLSAQGSKLDRLMNPQ